MQDTQTLKAKIITLLDFLPAESLKTLAEFATFLGEKSESVTNLDLPYVQMETTLKPRQKIPRISSPRLVNRDEITDFKLEVSAEESHDRL